MPKKHVIACRVLEAEVQAIIETEKLDAALHCFDMGWHDQPPRLRTLLQESIDRLDEAMEAEIGILVYGLCGLGLHGLTARSKPLVLPRAHDCFTLYLGSSQRYLQAMQDTPGIYWYAPGWQKAGRAPGQNHREKLRQQYRERFDEDQVEALLEMEEATLGQHDTIGYVDLDQPGDQAYADEAAAAASYFGWKLRRFPGHQGLLRRLLCGPWEEMDFLTVPPGHTIRATGDERIMVAELGVS